MTIYKRIDKIFSSLIRGILKPYPEFFKTKSDLCINPNLKILEFRRIKAKLGMYSFIWICKKKTHLRIEQENKYNTCLEITISYLISL